MTTEELGIDAKPIARLGDDTFGVCQVHGNQYGKIVSSSTNVFVNGRGIARLGDEVLANCGHTGIISSSATITFVNGKGIARVGDSVEGIYSASIISGSEDSFNVL